MSCTRKGRRDGLDHTFRIDVDEVVAYELENPSWSIMDEFASAEKGRLSSLDRLCGFMGHTYKEFVQMGFDMSDLAEICMECMKSDLGFPMPEDSGPESP